MAEASQDVAVDTPYPSQVLPKSSQVAGPIAEIADQQTETSKRRNVKTTLEAAFGAYPCLAKAFPGLPNGDVTAFLADLPAAEGALAINPTPRMRKGQIRNMVFTLPESRGGQIVHLKAALAQSRGILSE